MSYQPPDPDQPGGPPPSWGQPPGYPPPGQQQSWGQQPPGYPPPPGQPPGYGQQPPGYQQYPYQPGANDLRSQPVLAGWWYRVGATIIDTIILSVVSGILIVVAGGLGGRIIGVLVGLAYNIVLIGGRGATVGQMALGTKTLDVATGTPIGYGRAFIRYIVEIVLFLLLVIPGILDLLWPLWDAKNQTLHDKAANSVVVRVR